MCIYVPQICIYIYLGKNCRVPYLSVKAFIFTFSSNDFSNFQKCDHVSMQKFFISISHYIKHIQAPIVGNIKAVIKNKLSIFEK